MSMKPIERAIADRARKWLVQDRPRRSGQTEGVHETTADVRTAVINVMQQHLCDHYTRRPGIAPLCQAIAARMAGYGVDVDPDAGVVISGGAEETRFVAIRTLAAGKELFVPDWAEERYRVAAEFAGATITTVDPGKKRVDADRGLLVLPTWRPDTGQTLDERMLEHLIEWTTTYDLTIVADEIDVPLLSEHNKQHPLAGDSRLQERTLTLGGFAQTPALSAWQVAWFAGPKALVATVRALKQAMTICSPAPGQYAALASLQGNML